MAKQKQTKKDTTLKVNTSNVFDLINASVKDIKVKPKKATTKKHR